LAAAVAARWRDALAPASAPLAAARVGALTEVTLAALAAARRARWAAVSACEKRQKKK